MVSARLLHSHFKQKSISRRITAPGYTFNLKEGKSVITPNHVYTKLGNGTIRDLTLDTNTDTVYTHPAVQQCSNVNATTLNGMTVESLISTIQSKLGIKICSGSFRLSSTRSTACYGSTTLPFTPKAVIANVFYESDHSAYTTYLSLNSGHQTFCSSRTGNATEGSFTITWSDKVLYGERGYDSYGGMSVEYIALSW